MDSTFFTEPRMCISLNKEIPIHNSLDMVCARSHFNSLVHVRLQVRGRAIHRYNFFCYQICILGIICCESKAQLCFNYTKYKTAWKKNFIISWLTWSDDGVGVGGLYFDCWLHCGVCFAYWYLNLKCSVLVVAGYGLCNDWPWRSGYYEATIWQCSTKDWPWTGQSTIRNIP